MKQKQDTRSTRRRRDERLKGYDKFQSVVDGYPVSYYWTHEITRNLKHNSETCTRCVEGHKKGNLQ